MPPTLTELANASRNCGIYSEGPFWKWWPWQAVVPDITAVSR